ncbi:STAS domain-containing protein [Micromonospora sp. CPCC 206061]|uniref:STAS domain-containing protein n=1 Tax=Micromonospora sp. CPCC 206061 TaxID=3122410 RepID=UPI002FEF8F8F
MSVATTQPGTRACTVPLVEMRITGPLDMTATQAIRTTLDTAIALNPHQLVLDLAECPVIDAAAIGLLLDIHRHLWRSGAVLTLRSPTPRLRHILRIARVDNVLRIEPNVAATESPAAATADTPPVAEEDQQWRSLPPPPVPSAFVRAHGRARPGGAGRQGQPPQDQSE